MSYEEEDTCVAYELTRYACLRIGACAIKTGTGGLMTPKDMIGAGLAKFKNARDDSSSGGGDSDAWSDSDW